MEITLLWHELADNPESVRSRYTDPPALSPFMLRELSIYGHDATLTLVGELSRAPDSSIDDESAVASLGLVFWNVADVALDGSLVDRALTLEIKRTDDGNISVAVHGSGHRLSATCQSFEIVSFDVYSDLSVQRNRSTLFAHPNVWNSCLLRLRNAGYDLELKGAPDPAGHASHCQWHASQDQVVLKAANPIELLGLAQLHRGATEPANDPYWWHVDGPDIVTDLEDAWWRTWRGDKPR